MNYTDDAKYELRKVADLQNWDENPRQIKDTEFERLKEQIKHLGVYKPLLINQQNIVLGGNMRLRVFKDLGVDEVMCSVVLTDNPAQMMEYALSDNDQAGITDEQAVAEFTQLYPIKSELFAVNSTPMKLVSKLQQEFGPEAEEDEPPEVDEGGVALSVLGTVYQLGRHRVMCGDSTIKENVDLLMDGNKADMVFTDPPYGMDLETDFTSMKGSDGKWKGGNKYDKVIGDDKEYDPQHIFDIFDCDEVVLWGGDYYADKLPKGGSWIVWDKRLDESADKGFGSSFELAWSKTKHKREILRIKWFGLYGTETQDSKKRLHPTQKPLQVCSWFINKLTKPSNVIVDLFLGSGSTLIACEQTDRTCYGMELDPKYVDVIRKRWAKFMNDGTLPDDWEAQTPAIIESVS